MATEYGTSFLVPVDNLTLTDQRTYKALAISRGVERYMELRLATSVKDLVVRTIRPNADFGVGVGAAAEENWRFNLAAAGLNANAITVLARPANQIVVFFGIDNWDANPEVTLVTFKTAVAGGTTKMMVDTQICRGYINSAGFLSEPVVYDPQEDILVDIAADAISATQQCIFNGYIIEKRGQVIS